MPLDASIYSTPPTYIDNVQSAAKVPVVNSSIIATNLAAGNIKLSANNETGVSVVDTILLKLIRIKIFYSSHSL